MSEGLSGERNFISVIDVAGGWEFIGFVSDFKRQCRDFLGGCLVGTAHYIDSRLSIRC